MTLLGGTALKSLDENVRLELAAALGALPTTLSDRAAAASIAEANRKAAVSMRNDVRAQIWALMSQVRDALKAGLAGKDEYDLCGFDYPEARGTYEAQDPTDLSAAGTSNGVNTIKFSGNNPSGRVVYEIWRRHGDTGEWRLHATTKRQRYSDTGVTPGQYYEYRVRGVAARSVSNFSNSGVVYGTL